MPAVPGVTRNISNWDVNKNYVERVLDNAAYSSAHPDDTLLLAGPARKSSISTLDDTTGIGSLLALGQMEMMNITSTQPVQPLQAIGSARTFYSVGKPMHQIQVGRLIMNGRNLLRALYHNAVASGLDVGANLGSAASYEGLEKQQWYMNLDSPLYRVPFGLGVLFRDRAKNHIGGIYLELCIVQNWSVSVASGQSMIMENVSLLCDQLKPFGDSSTVDKLSTLFDAVLDFPGATEKAKSDAGISDNLSS